MHSRVSPVEGVIRGGLAGLAGSAAQELFFAATRSIAPSSTTGEAFVPPEPVQESEMPTVTVARRFVESFMRRAPIEDKARAGELVHYAFGGAWGVFYGVVAGSARAVATLPGALAFGAVVWAVSDDVILPAFQLSAWPHKVPVKNHAYAIAAHLVYGAAVWLAFRATRRSTMRRVLAALSTAWLTRNVPRLLRAPARGALGAAKAIRPAIEDAVAHAS